MGKIFRYDSPVVQKINKTVDLVILNLLFILTCIPFVTVGAAQTALYATIRSRIFHDAPLWSTYFRAFLSNLKQTIVLWLLMAVIGALGILGMYFYFSLNADLFFIVIHGLLLLLWASVVIWIFVLQERFDNRIRHTVYNAFFCAVSQLPRTVAALIVKSIPLLLFYFFPSVFLYLLPFFLAIWSSLSGLILLYLFKKPISSMEALANNQGGH